MSWCCRQGQGRAICYPGSKWLLLLAPYPIPGGERTGRGWPCLAAWQTEQYWTLPFSPHRDLKPENILLDDHGGLGSHSYGVE